MIELGKNEEDIKERMKDFIDMVKNDLFFYIDEGFWSKPKLDVIENWFQNFSSLEERYCASKLIHKFVYYSEEDILRLLDFCLYEKIMKRDVLKLEKEKSFSVKSEDIERVEEQFFESAYVLPLSTGNLSESSFAMLRYLTVEIGFPESNVLKPWDLKSETLSKAKNLIIIDDFIGTGKQIKDFWNLESIVLDGVSKPCCYLKDTFSNLELDYLCLVATEEGLNHFRIADESGYRGDLRVSYGEVLGGKFKVFGRDSMYFENEEIDRCKDILRELCHSKGINFLGYEGVDYAIAFHHSIPDCSLPLFSTQTTNWNYLFINKKTHAHGAV